MKPQFVFSQLCAFDVDLKKKWHLAPPPSCSSEEGGGRGVREVDGAVCGGAPGGRWVGDESVCGNPCGGRAQHPDARRLPDVAGECAFILKGRCYL